MTENLGEMQRVRKSIGDSIEARKLATCALEFLDIALKDVERDHPKGIDRFWEEIVQHIPKQYLPVSRDLPMTEQEAKAYGKTTMVWGKYKGTVMADVPLSYLVWLDAQDDDRRQLNRYLRSDLVQREQRSA